MLGVVNDCVGRIRRSRRIRQSTPDATLARLIRPTVYALRCNNIDLIWPMARVGFSPFGHTLTQFMML